MKITAEITQEQKDFLELIIHQDAANSVGGKSGELGNAVQWCIDACMRIEKLYEIDACYVSWHDIRLPENDPNPSESSLYNAMTRKRGEALETIESLQLQYSKMVAVAQDFIHKVDTGKARSTDSYNKFKEALNHTTNE